MRFELELRNRNITNEELLEDLKNVAKITGKKTVTQVDYDHYGKFSHGTIEKRLPSWLKALELANLEPSRTPFNIPNEELFDNLKNVWIKLELQPKREEVKRPLSKYSGSTYERRFGTGTRR